MIEISTGPRGSHQASGTRTERNAPEHTLLLSAGTQAELRRYAGALARRLSALTAGEKSGEVMADAAYTLAVGRSPLAQRIAVDAADPAAAIRALRAFADRDFADGDNAGTLTSAGENSRGDNAVAGTVTTFAEAVRAWLGGSDIDLAPWWPVRRSRLALPAPSRWTPRAPQTEQTEQTAQAPDDAPEPERVMALTSYLTGLWAQTSGLDQGMFDASAPLEQIGLSSFVVTRMNARLQADLGEHDRTLFFSHGDLASVARTLASRHPVPAPDPAPPAQPAPSPQAQPAPPAQAQAQAGSSRHADRSRHADDRVAIIGMAGRLPGARTLAGYWQNLASGRDCVGRVPADRARPGWPVDEMWGGYLDDVASFDPLLFSIAPRDAELMDPQERLFLEVAWECLEDAGYTRARLRTRHGGQAGVFVGAMHNEYPYFGIEQSLAGQPQDAGASLAGIANRVSFFLDLHGISLSVDTMCSSSLTALHLAMRSLRSGENEVAIVGGTNLSLHPNKFVQQHRMHLAATDHRCRSFGAGGDGFVPAEAVVAVLLKPLSAAIADGDRVHAVLAGSSVVHAGRTNGYLVPNPVAQGDMIARAWQDAGLDPASAGYLEAHGAGTALGDPVEIAGLLRVFGAAGLPPGSVPIGSVKSCIGHAEAVAGLAALLKVVLQIRHGEFAPTLHAQTLNPEIEWDAVPFRVQRERAPWERRDGQPRRAGISSFGAGGAIAHVVLEEFTGPPPATMQPVMVPPGGRHVVVLSGRDDQALRRCSALLSAALHENIIQNGPLVSSLPDIAYTSQVGREQLRERLAIVADSVEDVARALDAYLSGDTSAVLRGSADPSGGPSAGPNASTGWGRAPATAALRQWAPDADLDELARAWVRGETVDWEAAGTRPPGRIVDLPHYPFEAIRCWLPEPGAAPDVPAPDVPASVAAQVPTVPVVPLFERSWTPDGPVAGPELPAGRVVCVFSGHSQQVARAIAGSLGDRAVLVREGEIRAGDVTGFVTEEEAVRLVGQLLRGTPVSGWIDIADLYRPSAEVGLWRARLAALRALIIGAGRDVRIMHARFTGDGRDGDGTPGGARAAVVAGVVRALAAEGSVAAARTVDSDVPPSAAAEAARQLLGELRTDSRYPHVRHSGGLRYRPSLVPVGPPDRAFALSPAASYVVTGGTRGIGARVARWLAGKGARRIALIGRTALDDEQQAAVRHLRGKGAQVLVHTGSLADRPAVAEFFARVRRELGPVDGIVHCAGASDRAVAFTAKDFTAGQAASAVLEPKVEGFEVLRDVTSDDHPSFAVLFSSICAVAPVLARGVSDYAAANGYLDAAASAGARLGDRVVQSVAWPQWAQSGRAAGADNVCAPIGIATLTDEEGLSVLEAVLARPGLRSAVPLPHTSALDLDAVLAVLAPGGTTPPNPPEKPEPVSPAPGGSVPAWLTAIFSATLRLPADRLDPDANFSDLGVESIMLGELLQAIERQVDRNLNPGLLLDHPTLTALAAALESELGEGSVPPADVVAGPDVAAVRQAQAVDGRTAAPAPSAGPRGRIAIIGAACRFPDAPDLETFWNNLVSRRNCVREVPRSRWDHRAYYRPRAEIGFSISKWGGFVEGIEEFDPDAFGMDDEEARALDPAIRLSLETTLACLADAGYPAAELAGRPVGVFTGARMSHYGNRVGVRAHGLRSDQNFITAYVAQHLDLRGPNMVVDSACSSSLVSMQLAMRSLAEGECEIAIAGGVEVLLDERDYIDLSAAGALSPSGRCATFDESADGFVPGEGCGLVVLKPLDAALADGDRIRAVIDAIAVNNDGRTMGVTTPSREGQERVIRQALARAGRAPAEIGMIEAHGTGTLIGDPIELRSLTEVFGQAGEPAVPRCPIGSVKSNIGHLLSAAGIAGVLKAMLAIERGSIPATLWCERPNPRFNFSRSPFFPAASASAWDVAPDRRVAGVSSFGLGGTNAHAVLSGLDDAARVRPVIRAPLPPPVFRRRRLWYERDADADAGCERRGPRAVASLLDLELIGGQR